MGKKITIIGVGNIGSAIADGLLAKGFCGAEDLTLARRNVAALQTYADQGVRVLGNNSEAVKDADYVILAVKPFQIQDIAREIKEALDPEKQTLISVITGVWLKDMEEMFSEAFSLVRAMPNTAAAIGESMTCISSNKNVGKEQLDFVSQLFANIGETTIVDEQLMDASTVLGACGTAFALRYIRANIQGGIEIGFHPKVATLIAAQTVKGAACLLLENGTHPEQEIDKVTTPKGCTIAGLNEMEHEGFSSSLIQGIKASFNKILKDM